ncbi:MAG: GPR endopeptidase [Clostridia bacterium]
MIKTDLVLETCEILKDSNFDLSKFSGVFSEEYFDNTCKITKVCILNEQGAEKIGKPIGDYYTIEIQDRETNDIIYCIKNILKSLVQNCENFLIAGIGNKNITPDALGPMVADNSIATRHLLESSFFEHLNEVSVISTNVLGKTGIETGVILKNICKDVKPDCILAIDALAAKNPARLGTVIQISNTGLTPGSGIGNDRFAINQQNLGVKVVAIGVPTVITGKTLAYSISKTADFSLYENIIVTPKEIDNIIKKTSKIISLSINQTLNHSLSEQDIEIFLE